MPTTIDLTGLDVDVKASTAGGARRLNIQQADGSAMNLTGVTEFSGFIVPNSSAPRGEGTELTWPVIDEEGGGINCVIPSGVDSGTHWLYVTATVEGALVEITGPLTITEY